MLRQACQITLRKMEGGIHGLDFSVTAHTEVDGNETIHEPDIGGQLPTHASGCHDLYPKTLIPSP